MRKLSIIFKTIIGYFISRNKPENSLDDECEKRAVVCPPVSGYNADDRADFSRMEQTWQNGSKSTLQTLSPD
jgi:hypothetical protein